MSFAETYNYYMYEMADPRVISWPFLDIPSKIIWVSIIYLLIVKKIGPAIMRNREPFNLKQILRAYNVFQILSCCYLVYGLLKYGWWGKYSFSGCHPIDYSDDYEAVELAKIFWWTFMLKLCEFIETVFFVLRKKDNQVTGLHLYHHVSTMMFCWIGARFVPGGMASYPILINNSVHIIMYSYYLASTFGPKWQKVLRPWKPKITMLQMIQFIILIIYSLNAMRLNCNIPKMLGVIFLPNIILLFYMFYDFYKNSYMKKRKEK